jgi:hypothetical protein
LSLPTSLGAPNLNDLHFAIVQLEIQATAKIEGYLRHLKT